VLMEDLFAAVLLEQLLRDRGRAGLRDLNEEEAVPVRDDQNNES
jgi:hypothetical protein